MSKGRKGIKRLGVGMVFAAIAVAGSVAVAAWLSSGTGSGFARATTAQSLTTIDASASTSATLYPGATGNVTIDINNPNPYPVRVTSVTGNGTITSSTGAACNASTGVTFTNQTGLTLDVGANTDATFTLNGAVSMSNASDNSCQGAVFTIPVSLSGQSNAELHRPHRSPRLRTALRSALLIALVGGALTSAAAVPRTTPPSEAPATRAVVVHGRVRGLYPGATKRMRVIVRNPTAGSVRLVRMTARVSNASSACTARSVAIRAFRGSLTIEPFETIRIHMRSRMRRRAPNACQGARFPVTFTAALARA